MPHASRLICIFIGILVSNFIIVYALIDSLQVLISPLYKNSLDFNNVYFLLLEPKYLGGWQTFWGPVPLGPNVEPPLLPSFRSRPLKSS